MKNMKLLLLVPAALLAAACGRDSAKTDDALKNDLALASQAQPYNAQQFTSPSEMGYVFNPATGQYQPVPRYQSPVAQQPVYRTAARPTARPDQGNQSRQNRNRPCPDRSPERLDPL